MQEKKQESGHVLGAGAGAGARSRAKEVPKLISAKVWSPVNLMCPPLKMNDRSGKTSMKRSRRMSRRRSRRRNRSQDTF